MALASFLDAPEKAVDIVGEEPLQSYSSVAKIADFFFGMNVAPRGRFGEVVEIRLLNMTQVDVVTIAVVGDITDNILGKIVASDYFHNLSVGKVAVTSYSKKWAIVVC